jgi:molybdopterin molybdotransferase
LIDYLPAKGTHIRRQGEDEATGATLLPAGRLIGAKEAGALGAAGIEEIPVRNKVRVAVLVTGTELGGADRPGKIADANTPFLLTALAQPWISVLLPDDPAAIANALCTLAGRADLIVTTGGVSVGDEDHLRHAVRRAGGRVAMCGVAMKPGKPLSFGRAGGAFWLGLPGNPVAAFTCWTVIGLPVAAALAGLAVSPQRRIVARLAETVRHAPGRCEFWPVTLAGYGGDGAMVVRCLQGTGSHRAAQLAGAEALALIPAEAEMLPEGALVEIILL